MKGKISGKKKVYLKRGVVSPGGGLSLVWLFIRVVSREICHQGGLSPVRSLIRMATHQGDHPPRCSLIRMVF